MNSVPESSEKRAKILHVGPLPPSMGGVSMAMQMMLCCNSLSQYDHITFDTFDGRINGVAERKKPTPQNVLRYLKRSLNLANFARHVKPDIIHYQCGSESFSNIIGDFLVIWTGSFFCKRFILHLHLDPATSDFPGHNHFSRFLFSYLARPIQMIFTLTESYKAQLMSRGMRQKIVTVPNMCDHNLLSLSLDRFTRSDSFTVIYLGRLTEVKGVFDLLMVAASLCRDHPEIHFELAGLPSNGNDAKKIYNMIERYQLQKTVRLIGLVTGNRKRLLFERADVVLLPSYQESFGIVAIESMAAGLPVIGTNVSGLTDIIQENETGFLTAIGDIESMKNRLLTLSVDRNLCKRLGRMGRERYMERYSTEKIGSVIGHAYDELMFRAP